MTVNEMEQFKLPECWKDESRMSALFAIPRPESLNPHDWSGKYKFWSELILEWATFNRKVIIDVEELKTAFCRKGRFPSSLNRVLEEMQKKGEITPKQQFASSQTNSSSWASWGFNLVKSSVTWSFNQVLNSISTVDQEIQSYVVPSVLKEKCDQVLQHPMASSEEVVDIDELTDLYPELFLNDEETHLIFSQLQKSGKVAIESSSTQAMVKFLVSSNKTTKTKSAANSSLLWNLSPVKPKEKAAVEITEVDRSLATLKRTEKLLTDEIDKLEEEMNGLEKTAKARLKEGARGAAKAALYRRKQLQATFEKRNQALVNIQTMKLQLAQAKTDAKVMEAYKIGLSALKNSFSDLPLNEDKVQDTLIELESVLEQHRDIENVLSQGIATSDEATESDLEDELRDILALESQEAAAAAAAEEEEPELVLPSAPTDSPKAAATSTPTASARVPMRFTER